MLFSILHIFKINSHAVLKPIYETTWNLLVCPVMWPCRGLQRTLVLHCLTYKQRLMASRPCHPGPTAGYCIIDAMQHIKQHVITINRSTHTSYCINP